MTSTEEAKLYRMKPAQLRLAFKTNFTFFPIEGNELQASLARREYKTPSKPPSALPFGAAVEMVGAIAHKNNVVVTFDPDRQVIGVDGPSPEEVTLAFGEVEQIIREMQVDISAGLRFYETIITYKISSERSPRQTIEALPGEKELSSGISDILGIGVSPFGLRLGSKGMTPNQDEWIDIRIEPTVSQADREYVIALVYRSKETERVKQFLRSAENTFQQVIKYLEEHA